jgi:hypothetical protein
VQGWYFYKKTKNYRMIWSGLKEGGADALKLGIVGLGWAGMEDGMERLGGAQVKEVGAGLGTAVMFSAICEYDFLSDFVAVNKKNVITDVETPAFKTGVIKIACR